MTFYSLQFQILLLLLFSIYYLAYTSKKTPDKQAKPTNPTKAMPIPGEVQGQARWDSEQPDLVGAVHVHGVGVGIR